MSQTLPKVAGVELNHEVKVFINTTPEASGSAGFADSDAIADYAADAINALWAKKIICGYEDGTFLPQNPISRAEAAKIIYGIMKPER